SQFYTDKKASFEAAKKNLDECLEVYKQDLEAIKAALESRKATLFQSVPMPNINHDSAAIQTCVDEIAALVIENNGRTNSLEKDKEKARESLRLNDVATFISGIGYDAELTRIAGLKTTAEEAKKVFDDAEAEVNRQQAEVTRLLGQQKDERKGAER
uniref:AAA family ATPase n=1 Tax=Escherichia coli TaxID=562 RepID=UPI00129050BF